MKILVNDLPTGDKVLGSQNNIYFKQGENVKNLQYVCFVNQADEQYTFRIKRNNLFLGNLFVINKRALELLYSLPNADVLNIRYRNKEYSVNINLLLRKGFSLYGKNLLYGQVYIPLRQITDGELCTLFSRRG